jgi:hypothetical protein
VGDRTPLRVTGGSRPGSSPLPAEWCIVATVLPYPYRSEKAEHRSHGIFPAGAKVYVVGGFAGMGYETVTVIGYPHGRRGPVLAHMPHLYLGGWRVELVYRPVILRRIHQSEVESPSACARFRTSAGQDVTSEQYATHLRRLAAKFQESSTKTNP